MIKIKFLFHSLFNFNKIGKFLYLWNELYFLTLKHTYKKFTLVKSPKCHKIGKMLYLFSYPLIQIDKNYILFSSKILPLFYFFVFYFFYTLTLTFSIYKCIITICVTKLLEI